ncbi:MAG: hypothetical protein JXB32_02365, partial [Deltaproteobacteria bacterium]|nr:hypothetical protein [Deltaproteobacteria bacterium]
VAVGADPTLRARERAAAEAERLAAEAERVRAIQVRAEAERLELEARLTLEAQDRARREAERQERARLEAEWLGLAWDARADLKLALIGLGADPDLRRRQLEEQARLEAEAGARARQEREAALELELQAQRDAEVRFRLEQQAGFDLRADLSADLIALGADPDYRRRQAEEQARREAAERERREREQMFAEWDSEQQRLEAELRARAGHDTSVEAGADLQADLTVTATVQRPPRPAPQYEERPAAPATGAIWIPGEWVWNGVAWIWAGGRWELQAAGAAGTAAAVGLGILGLAAEGGVSLDASPVTVEVRVGAP